MKFCLIYNKNSAGGRKSKFIKKIYNEIKINHEIDLFETTSIIEASEIIKNIYKNNYKRLILAGGDGSVSFAINELIKNDIKFEDDFAIGYIPAGTANILQAELGMTKNIKKIAKTLTSNNLSKTNLVKINDRYFVLMAGIGWDAQIVQSIDTKIKKILGKVIFGIKGFEKFLLMKNDKIKVFINNEEILADWILCSNSRYYAGHHKITDTNIFEEKFTTYIFKDLRRMKLLYYIYLIIRYGNLEKSTSVITKNINELKMDGLNKQIPIQIDGDNFGSLNKITIKSSDKKINLLKAA
ncbi:diacylglycerol kinase family protein [Candidatus Pelagibacter sp.]|nr:diacylglycerol kinase family protein [Candidatus Pelagibacter sp.]